MSEAISYTNQKLFLASRLFYLSARAEAAPDRIAQQEGAIALLGLAYQGLLNELAATRRLKGRMGSLAELVEQSGYETEWTQRLQALERQPGSWLHELNHGVERLNRPGAAGRPITDASIIGSTASVTDWTRVIAEMKGFLELLRETNQQN